MLKCSGLLSQLTTGDDGVQQTVSEHVRLLLFKCLKKEHKIPKMQFRMLLEMYNFQRDGFDCLVAEQLYILYNLNQFLFLVSGCSDL